MSRKPLDWIKYPIRDCKTLHWCEVCHQNILNGQRYYDGGYSRRAHYTCGKRAVAEENARDSL